MRILFALGDEVPSGETEVVAHALAAFTKEHEVVLTHCYGSAQAHTFELALRNALPERDVVSLLTQVVVAADDPAVGTLAKATPHAIAEIRSLRALLASGALVICAGERRLPVALDPVGEMHGVETAVDEDLTAALLARRLDADVMAILTEAEPLISTMRAARGFAEVTGRRAAIGSLTDVAQVVRGAAGTQVQGAAAKPAIAATRRRSRH
jgi:carbamate kinase